MANHSDLTRKEQVFAYLRIMLDQWVDGTDLATEEVGGSEGLKRLRELRKDLADNSGAYEIQMRGHPDPERDIFQYRLVEYSPHVEPPTPYVEPPVQSVYDETAPTSPHASVEPGHEPERPRKSLNAPGRRGHVHYDREIGMYVAVIDDLPGEEFPPLVAVQTSIADVPEPDPHKFTSRPLKLGLGMTLPCPMCNGIHRAIKERDPVTGKAGKGSKVIGYEELTRNPKKPSETCPRCNGWGVIPS